MVQFSTPLFLTDADGRRVAVQIPVALWERLETLAAPMLAPPPETLPPCVKPEPLEAFKEFLQYWDFRYTYSPVVSCPHCGASAPDWREGDDRPFHLANANLGGLLVFKCRKCNATIRQKHFRDHVAYESTPPPSL